MAKKKAPTKSSPAKSNSRKAASGKAKSMKRFHNSEDDPIVFMFRPTHYEMVPNNKLKAWERDMAEKVGIQVSTASESSNPGARSLQWFIVGGGGATNSSSAGAGWDDSDYSPRSSS